MDLRDKVALVTGASMGIGRQISLDLARAGAVVVGVARGVEALRALLPLLQRTSPRSEVTPLDVAEAAAVREVVEGVVSRHARLDILINNAAVEERRSILATTVEDVDRVMRVNFGGMVSCTLAALPAMVRQGFGRIINVSSAVGRSPVPGEAAYCASKAAMIAFSESISYELESKGVRVQVLFPGYVPTTGIAMQARREGQTLPPRWVHRTAEQVSRAVLRALDARAFEINVAPLETLAPIVRAVTPAVYRRAILRTQPPP
ncbi:MAG: SDR family oxidoreductase [Deltaproteobacteria bacterium]|nr:MAG: SDR family oxidoreductase [Deltaproteobacteria bacterium]